LSADQAISDQSGIEAVAAAVSGQPQIPPQQQALMDQERRDLVGRLLNQGFSPEITKNLISAWQNAVTQQVVQQGATTGASQSISPTLAQFTSNGG
jgi:hypothetical protein